MKGVAGQKGAPVQKGVVGQKGAGGKGAAFGQKGPAPVAKAPGKLLGSFAASDAVQVAKLKRIEVIAAQTSDVYSELQEDKKVEALKAIATKLAKHIRGNDLSILADQLLELSNPVDEPNGDFALAEPVTSDFGAAEEEVSLDASMEGEDAGMEETYQEEANEEAAQVPTANPFQTACFDLLRQVQGKPPSEWSKAWLKLNSGMMDVQTQQQALVALMEASMPDASQELGSRIILDLTTKKMIEISALAEALKETASKMEDAVKEQENSWQLLPAMLVGLFPRTRSSDWGMLRVNWAWQNWWNLTEQVLDKADPMRAFDILIMVLQSMQEKSGNLPVKDQQVWKEQGRIALLKGALRKWGAMDDAGILDTLNAYGVEL